jgi:tetratricopeptide (TPR) repeat protein
MRPRRPAMVILGTLAAGALLATGCGGKSSTYTLVQNGNHAYSQGDAAKALNDYRQAQVQRPDLPVLNYNAGNALYQQGDYTRGITESQQATQNGDDALRAQAFYTIGADDYRQGKLQDALDAYKNALRIDPSDTDAKYNVELIQRQLDREAAARQGLPTPTPEPTRPAGQQGTPPAGQQQGGGQQPGQAGQQPGQSGQQQGNGQQGQSGQQGADPNGQSGANGQQGQPGQQGNGPQSPGNGTTQAGQPGQPGSSQAGQGTGGSANAAGQGTTGTPQPSLRVQQQQAQQALQKAIDAYQKGGSIDDALKILDALAQQQALQQQAQANQSDPHSRDK